MTVMTFQLCAYLSGFKRVERIKLNTPPPSSPSLPGNCAAEVSGGDRRAVGFRRLRRLLIRSGVVGRLLQTKTKLKF